MSVAMTRFELAVNNFSSAVDGFRSAAAFARPRVEDEACNVARSAIDALSERIDKDVQELDALVLNMKQAGEGDD